MEAGRYTADTLRDFSVRVLSVLGVRAEEARVVAECLLYAELHGHASHGIVRLPVYARRVQAGVVKAKARPRVGRGSGPVCVVDGDNGLGPAVGRFGMMQAIRRAHRFGIGMVSARCSNHFGPAGFYAEMALPELCIGAAASNAPPNMAPWGGRERFLGTNPLSVAVPAGKANPVVFDMASSVVARGNIILAAQRGESIPEGWAIDPEGKPTTDARLALLGSVLPFGGPKGSAISLLIDIFAGVLSGASFGRHLNTLEDLDHVQNLGHVFIAVDVGRFMPAGEFLARVDDLVGQLKATPTAPGVAAVLAPGEIELARCAELGKAGIPVSADVRDQLGEMAAGLGVAMPAPDAGSR